ncbi:MAG: FecR family protein [Roseateles sp.]|uniref:FecR domain-containing protein n=1 Tax=Roseateles sp. TaxID=1971397 RepID=UPI0039E9D82F
MNAASPQDLAPVVRQQAVEWLLELQAAPASDELRQRWLGWRAAHPDHERAWQHVEAFGAKLGSLPSALAHAALAPPPRRRQAAKTLALLLFTGGAAGLAWQGEPWQRWTADARTGTGERLALALPDGSQLQLNAGSAIRLAFTATERLLKLLGGEILVRTAADARPFAVETGQGRIDALGTRFSVRDAALQPDGACRVAVFDGAVELRPRRAPAAVLRLRAGQQGRLAADAAAATGAASDDATAWTQGLLVAQDMPLADFLAELARHRPGRLSCSDAVAGLKVSGTYPLADTDRVLELLQAALPVAVRRVTRYWVSVGPPA